MIEYKQRTGYYTEKERRKVTKGLKKIGALS